MIKNFPYPSLVLTVLLTLSSNDLMGYQLRGMVTNSAAEPLANVTVQIENSTYGVVTNAKGAYFLELEDGEYNVVYRALGYEVKVLQVQISGASKVVDVVLAETVTQLEEITVHATKEDPGIAIMKKAIEAKGIYCCQFETSKCTAYVKSNMEYTMTFPYSDSLGTAPQDDDFIRRDLEFIESLSEVYFKADDTYREIKLAHRDYMEDEELYFTNSAQLGPFSPQQEDYAPPIFSKFTPELFYSSVTEADFNFYQNLIHLPALHDRPFVSPLSNSALRVYDFSLVETFEENGVLIYKIRVLPKKSFGPFFSGHIYIVDEAWNIKSVEFELDRGVIGAFVSFRMFIEYRQVEGSYWVADREEFFYNYQEFGSLIMGHSVALYSNYEINPNIEESIFKGASSRLDEGIQEGSQEFWQRNRPLTLKPAEVAFLKVQDSIAAHKTTTEYILAEDSSYNRTDIWDILFSGIGYRNSPKGYQFYFDPVIFQMQPLAVGGYRQSIGGSYSRVSRETDRRLGLQGEVSFGPSNGDFRGFGNIYYEKNPEKFTTIEVGGGSIYEMVNTYESIVATFSRGNYVLTDFLSLAYKRELFNGFFGRAEIRYSDQQSLEEYKLADWSNSLFGDLNDPRPFERYTKLVLDARFTIRFKQNYYMKRNRKVILGSKYPRIRINYKLGIPEILGAEASFQFLEFRVFDNFRIGAMGTSKYNIYAGTFIRPKGTRYIDYKLFRGSDRYFYSDPLRSFQLLGPSINTKEPYVQAHYVHHFDGALLDKVPLLNQLRLRAVCGASTLLEVSNDFTHVEAYAGLSRVIRSGKDQFKIGLYYVQANSNAPNFTRSSAFKLGIDFYNSFTNSWSY